MVQQIKTGISVSKGIAIGKAIILDSEEYQIPHRCIDPALCIDEIERVNKAFDEAIKELGQLESEHHETGKLDIRDLFSVHRHFLQDESLHKHITDLIQHESVTAEYAVSTVFGQLSKDFKQVQDRYISGRAVDIADIMKRVLHRLISIKQFNLSEVDQEVIVVAKELGPTQIASFDPRFVKGFACDTGGETSHASIIARSMGFPTVVGLEDFSENIHPDDTIIVDGNSGTVVINPDAKTISKYQETALALSSFRKVLLSIEHEPAVTKDGVHINVLANIEFPYEVDRVLENGAEGIGLFRTEFLYLQRGTEPSEEEQYNAYAQVIKNLKGYPVTIRTMDLGADKCTQSHRFKPEANPFLGLRSIRFSLKHRDMFVAQLRAILRASVLGPTKIMFPLITNVKELMLAREVLNGVMANLEDEGIPYDKDIPVGIMIEVPSAALMARSLAKHAAFFSIGTNDLTQYALAVDRGNAQVAELFSTSEPAVLQLIKSTVEGAKANGIDVSVCGQMASEPIYIMLLLGMLIPTLSMTPFMVPEIKELIRSVTMSDCEKVAHTVLEMESAEQISEFLANQTRPLLPEVF
ncbi:MAG: phosphoenolpyruvate--protein phosphotransferase [Planctomycetota bacterium]|jgi:phosphotransferase system enzyme I (PtsI)